MKLHFLPQHNRRSHDPYSLLQNVFKDATTAIRIVLLTEHPFLWHIGF